MASARDSDSFNTADLEEGLSAASPPLNNSSSSAPSSIRNHRAPTATTDQPGAVSEVAAVATTSGLCPEIIDDASGLPLPTDIAEAISKDSDAFHHLAAVASTGCPAPPSGLEVMVDDDGPPVPTGVHELENYDRGKKRGAVELIEDDVGPDPPTAMLAESREQVNAKTNLINNFSPPTPLNLSALENNANEQKNSSMPSDVDSIIFPPSELENEDLHILARVDTRRGIREEDEQTPAVDNQTDIESNRLAVENSFDTGVVGDDGDDVDLTQNNRVQPGLGEDRETQIITEAYAVEERSDDGVIIHGHAEPLLPFWKQRKGKLSLAAVIVLFSLLAVSLGVPLSLKASDATPAAAIVLIASSAPSESPTEKPSDPPSTTSSPSYDHSDSPSASLVPTALPSIQPASTPSYSPSACVNQISSDAQKIDLPIDDPFRPNVAVDGNDMAIVAQQRDWNGPVFIIFYTLTNGEWQRVKTFQKDDLGGHPSVALSGNMAFVGDSYANDYAGAVSVYEKDQYGDWDLLEDPFIHDASATFFRFGYDVDINEDLACVEDLNDVYLYHRENNKWVQFDRIEDTFVGESTVVGGSKCYIAGDTIATKGQDNVLGRYLQLYRYNPELDGVIPIQNPITTGGIWSLGWSDDYLVYWDADEEDAFMYRREDTNQTYTFRRQFNISGPSGNYGLAMDNDMLVVGGNDETHIFTEQNTGQWEETITLGRSYTYYALSGRSLIATTPGPDYEVYYFDIEDCSQAMPTQTPSLSLAPTDLPTSSPSMSPSTTTMPSASFSPSMSSSPTSTPSSSASPTLLQCIQVSITYDDFPQDTSWELERVVGDGDNELVRSHQASWGDSYVESLCLRDAEYIFTIYDYAGEGICCNNGEGNYNVTSNGMLIVKGGEYGAYERTTFSIPFVPYPSMSPSPTTAPSSSSSPSMIPSSTTAPSSSSSPTETCNWIQVAITYDGGLPWETSWELERVVGGGGDNEVLKSHQGSVGDVSFFESLCLQEGKYIFIISGGLCCFWGEGNYKVTSNGVLIVEGGEFAHEESTTFSIPFVPYPSMSPSSSPTAAPSSSSSPSMIPSSTTAPSSSSSPTLLQCIEVAMTYDSYPEETSWVLERVVGGGGDNEVVKSHQGSVGDVSFFESLCLRDAEYIFTIYDAFGDGFKGNYNVTSNGMMIAEGGVFRYSERTTFPIPTVPSS